MLYSEIQNPALKKILAIHYDGKSNAFSKALKKRDITKLDKFFSIAKEENVNLFQYILPYSGNTLAVIRSCEDIMSKEKNLEWLHYLSSNGLNIADYTVNYNIANDTECLHMPYFVDLLLLNNSNYAFDFLRAFVLENLLEIQKENFYQIKNKDKLINSLSNESYENHYSFRHNLWNSSLKKIIIDDNILKEELFKIPTKNLLYLTEDKINGYHFLYSKAKLIFEQNKNPKMVYDFFINLITSSQNKKIMHDIFVNTGISFDNFKEKVVLSEELFFGKRQEYYVDKNIYSSFLEKIKTFEELHPEHKFSFSDNFKINPYRFIQFLAYSTNDEDGNKRLMDLNIRIDTFKPYPYLKAFFNKYEPTEPRLLKQEIFSMPKDSATVKYLDRALQYHFTEKDINKAFPMLLDDFINNKLYESPWQKDLIFKKMALTLSYINDQNLLTFFNKTKTLTCSLFKETFIHLKDKTVSRLNNLLNGKLFSAIYENPAVFNYHDCFFIKKILLCDFPNLTENEITNKTIILIKIKTNKIAEFKSFKEQYYLSKMFSDTSLNKTLKKRL